MHVTESGRDSYIDIVRILELCRDIEVYCSEMYRYYAEIFADNDDISRMWTKTAAEEENHANQFVMAINLRKQGMVESTTVDVFRAETTLNAVKSIYDGVRQCKPSLIDALRSAIKLEKKLEEFHMTTVALFTDESYKKLFTAMMKADHQHLANIESAYQKALNCPTS